MMPYWSNRIGVPRTLAVEFPFGHTLGQPHNVEQQTRVLKQALDVLETADSPGTIVHSEEIWPVPQKEAYKGWQPKEPSPIIQYIAPRFRQMMKDKPQE